MELVRKSGTSLRKVLFVILDGVGVSPRGPEYGNAIAAAKMPFLKEMWEKRPTVQIKAHGTAVGMPSDEDMGNSEVGHNVLGCGRIFDQGAKLVSNSIQSGAMFEGEVWKEAISKSKNNHTLHFLGLFSDGNVHSHIDHLKAMLTKSKEDGAQKVRIHILLDGRDVGETSALDYLIPFEEFLSTLRSSDFDVKIASGGGRMEITMDRYEADWSMVDRGWKTHVLGEGRFFGSAQEAIETFREEKPGTIDQYLPAFVIAENDSPVGKIQDGDSVIFFNFRGDRAIEISRAFTEKEFSAFDRGPLPEVYFAGMMQYDGDLKLPEHFLVEPPLIDRTLGEYMAKSHIKQFALSETQKYGHVTYFWNGNRSGYFDKTSETYQEILSDVIPFDQAPNMKAEEITKLLTTVLTKNENDFYRVNYANGDMVGHTGNFPATVECLEELDSCMKTLYDLCKERNIVMLVTADHGNADEMYMLDKKGEVQRDKTGKPVPKTSHTLNPVNFLILDPEEKIQLNSKIEGPGLANVAATVLDIMGFEAPEGYFPSLLASS